MNISILNRQSKTENERFGECKLTAQNAGMTTAVVQGDTNRESNTQDKHPLTNVAESKMEQQLNSPMIEIRGITKLYGQFPALEDLTMNIPRGGIFALLGPNGAGKTTLIKLLMGMLQPTHGELKVGGLCAFGDSVKVKSIVGYVPDEPVFYDYLRGRELIQFVGQLHGLDRATIESRSQKLAERLLLDDALEEFAENYSRGMKKKLALICALIHEPEFVVLDEPTNGLDPHGTLVLHELMREIASSGRTVMFSTHLLDQAQRLCQRIAIFHRGKLAAEGTMADLQSRFGTDENLEAMFFRLTEQAAVQATVTGQNGEGVQS
jgi:ABC-2 type transport system ATP-binding protein